MGQWRRVPAAALSGVSAIAAAGNFTLSLGAKTTVAFGSQNLGTTSTAKTFYLKNTGGATLFITGAALTGQGNDGDFTVNTAGMTTSLAPGGQTTLTVTFHPTALGTRTATLRVLNNDAGESTFNITLTGTGAGVAAPEIVIDPPLGTTNALAFAFGDQLLGAPSAARAFTIRNTGSGPLHIIGVSTVGTNNANFTANTAGMLSSIPVGGQTTFTVTFTPPTLGSRATTLLIVSDDADEATSNIALTGNGLGMPEIVIQQPAGTNVGAVVDFAHQNLGTSSPGKIFAITNTGNATLNLTGVSTTGANAGDYSANSTGMLTNLPAGGATTFTVTFTPTAVGSRTTTLRVLSDDADESVSDILLTGVGVAVTQVFVEQPAGVPTGIEAIDFTNQVVGSTSAPKPFTIRNNTSTNLLLYLIGTTTENKADFIVDGTGTPPSIPAGGTAIFTVAFRPTATGVRITLVHVTWSDPAAITYGGVDVPLAGNGIPLVVTTSNDSGAGSLRQLLAGAPAGANITFATNLSGATITLTTGQLTLTNNLNIDASALPAGIKISGNNASRAFGVSPGATNTLNRLTITGCTAGGGYGGSILNQGVLTLTNCTLAGNNAFAGGATYNPYLLTLNNCTISSNSAYAGGGIQNEGNLIANNSTFTANTGDAEGGAISAPFGAPVTLKHCTLSGNTSAVGGGIGIDSGGTTLYNTIIAGNTGATGSNIYGSFIATGVNLTNGNPLLAPLGNYGGPTQTMPPLGGSPALDRCTNGTSFATDQRGLPRVVGSFADIGAVEFPGNQNYGLGFNGTNQFVTVPGFGNIIPTNEVTVEFWCYTPQFAQQFAFVLNPDNAANRFAANNNYINSNSYWDFGNIGPGNLNASGRIFAPNPAGTLGNWTHYALVASVSGNSMTIYTNGAVFVTHSGANPAVTPFVRGQYDLLVGGMPNFYFIGKLDEFRVWNRARSQAEIQALKDFTLTGSESNLVLYLRFGVMDGNTVTNLATATGPAYNGAASGNPTLVAGPPLFTTTAGAPAFALAGKILLAGGAFQLSFTNLNGLSFTVLTSTNVALPLSNWTMLGAPGESPPGQYQFTDPQATNNARRFYRVRSP